MAARTSGNGRGVPSSPGRGPHPPPSAAGRSRHRHTQTAPGGCLWPLVKVTDISQVWSTCGSGRRGPSLRIAHVASYIVDYPLCLGLSPKWGTEPIRLRSVSCDETLSLFIPSYPDRWTVLSRSMIVPGRSCTQSDLSRPRSVAHWGEDRSSPTPRLCHRVPNCPAQCNIVSMADTGAN